MKVYENFKTGCEMIIKNCPDNYAKIYAKAGIKLIGNLEYTRTQAVYILNNTRHWRGEDARKAKDLLNKFLQDTKE